jgi:hypothetical protein
MFQSGLGLVDSAICTPERTDHTCARTRLLSQSKSARTGRYADRREHG